VDSRAILVAPLRDSILAERQLRFGVWGPFEIPLAINPKQSPTQQKKSQNILVADILPFNSVPKV